MDYFEQENSRRPSPFVHAILNTQINSAYIPQMSGQCFCICCGLWFYPWFKFYFPLFLSMVRSLKQRKIKFKPRIKLNHNISIKRLSSYLHLLAVTRSGLTFNGQHPQNPKDWVRKKLLHQQKKIGECWSHKCINWYKCNKAPPNVKKIDQYSSAFNRSI